MSSARLVADRCARALARWLAHLFFRRVEIVGREHIPADAPLVVVVNHVNGMVDPLLVIAALPRMPRFLGKSTLWRIWPLRPILALGGVVPVYRRHDPGVDPARNQETFAHSRAALLRGEILALFPEGISHDEPALQPLKSGAARIALEAESAARAAGRPLGVRILPIGLDFDERESFRSRALVRIGPTLDLEPELPLHASDPIAATAALTARIEEALQTVVLSYDSWNEARLIAHGAELAASDNARSLPRERRLAEAQDLRRSAVVDYRRLRDAHPELAAEIAATVRAVRQYDRLLEFLDLRDDQVTALYPRPAVWGATLRTLVRLCLLLPLAAVGTALNAIPFFTVRTIARHSAADSLRATVKLYSAIFIYPLAWLAAAALVRRAAGPPWGTVAFVAAPLCGWVALRFHEQRERFTDEARAYLLLSRRRDLAEELRRRRDGIREKTLALREVLGEQRSDPPR